MKKPIIYSLGKSLNSKLNHIHLEVERSQKVFLLIKRLIEEDLKCSNHCYDVVLYESDEEGNPSDKPINIESSKFTGELLEISDEEFFIYIFIKKKRIELKVIALKNEFIHKMNKLAYDFKFAKPIKKKTKGKSRKSKSPSKR